jgi:hypothetical protein
MNIDKFLNYKNEIFWVDDEHRVHPWSVEPGGSTVVVEYLNGQILGYDKVKRPHRYMPKIFKEDKRNIYTIWNDGTLDKYLEDYVKRIYASKEGSNVLDEIWKHGDKESPIEKLEEYKTK